jgi:hypothetical protein
VPVAVIVIGALVVPGAMFPVVNAPLSAVTSWTMLSAFIHATDWPATIDAGFGENELLPFWPVTVIVNVAPPGVGVGVGVGVGEVGLLMLLLLPQPTTVTAAKSSPPSASVSFVFMISPPSAGPAA